MSKIHVVEIYQTDGTFEYEPFTNKRTAYDYAMGLVKVWIKEVAKQELKNLKYFAPSPEGLEALVNIARELYLKDDTLLDDSDRYPSPTVTTRILNNTSIVSRAVFTMMDDNMMLRERGFSYTK